MNGLCFCCNESKPTANYFDGIHGVNYDVCEDCVDGMLDQVETQVINLRDTKNIFCNERWEN